MRIGIAGFMHESNTFLGEPTTLADFRADLLTTGDGIRNAMRDAHHEVGGFLEALDTAGVEAVPLLFARALPSGTIARETLDDLMGILFSELDHAGPLDGLLTAPHGANVCESQPDMDGYWLSRLRERLGADTPMVSTLDLHANLSPRMVEAVDAFVAYRSNPHLDQRQRGVEAADLLIRTLRGEIRPVSRAAFPRVAINIERQNPDAEPCRMLYDLAAEIRSRPQVLSTSILLGFPYADVEEMGSAFVVVTDGDPDLAQSLADEMASRLVAHREQFVGQFISADEAIKTAMDGPGPVCLLDMGDNVGGGSPGDGALLGKEFERYMIETGTRDRRAFLCLYDPEAVEKAGMAGAGARLPLSMGGKSHPLYGAPLEAEVTVVSLHQGKFTETEVRHYGMTHFDMGPTAIVETASGLVVQLTSRRVYPTSLNQLTSCGVDPGGFQVLIAKGVHAPVAAYAPVSARLIRVNTPGVTCADMRQLSYAHRRRPLYPFEDLD